MLAEAHLLAGQRLSLVTDDAAVVVATLCAESRAFVVFCLWLRTHNHDEFEES